MIHSGCVNQQKELRPILSGSYSPLIPTGTQALHLPRQIAVLLSAVFVPLSCLWASGDWPSMLYHYHVVCRSRLRVFSPLSIRSGKTLSELRGLPNDRPRHRQTPSCLYRESCLTFFGVKLWFRYSIALRSYVAWAIVPFRTRALSRHGFVDALPGSVMGGKRSGRP